VSLAAIISRDDARACCSRCGEDIINEREVIVEGCVLCRACAEGAYYAVQQPEYAAISHPLPERN
ncbi:MAG: TraR/DksA C4-type zinc finger protein, partial [Anaerolineae bacterium]|nr:TraR/DksA C4-type zinc finger protein [Anaerolineae bacterium]